MGGTGGAGGTMAVDASVDQPGPGRDAPGADLRPDAPLTNQPNGAACTRPNECRSGNCVDGVCCNERCNNGCQACVKSRTDKPDGTCGVANDLENKACGKGCGRLATISAVFEKVCVRGVCVIPEVPKVVSQCADSDPCSVLFCEEITERNDARCVSAICGEGQCCCRQGNTRSCQRMDQCRGAERMCVQ
jgi:hypothetical protein